MSGEVLLIIARHGNTFGPTDVVTRVGARTDLPLVASGLEQGLKLGLDLKRKGLIPDQIFTSNLKRTRMMAQQVQASLGLAVPCKPLSQFNEIDYGPDENQPEDKVKARIGEAALVDWELHSKVPSGWNVDVSQIENAWKDFSHEITRDLGRTILLITHNGIARFAPILLKEKKPPADQSLKLSTGAYGVFKFKNSEWVFESWNVKPS